MRMFVATADNIYEKGEGGRRETKEKSFGENKIRKSCTTQFMEFREIKAD